MARTLLLLALIPISGMLVPNAWGQLPVGGFLPDLSGTTGPVTQALVSTVAFGLDHRPMEPATPLGVTQGLELGLELALVRFPDKLVPALQSIGADTSALEMGVIPAPKLHLRKGIGPNVTFGSSFVWYQQILVYGMDLKYTFLQPEEGVTWAIRLCYSKANVMYVKSTTWAPQLLISRALEFADPYLGLGAQLATGEMNLSFEASPGVTAHVRDSANVYAFQAFIGTKFRPPNLGIQFTLEGGYNHLGMHWLSTRAGVSF